MEKMGQELDPKFQLVIEICSISMRSIACVHRKFSIPEKSDFIDWYHVLGVEEDADLEITRKQYYKLALQLHPDKNKHPKAEIAFKLVSEAYRCLSDNERRRVFNKERWKNFCIECNKIPYKTCSSSTNSTASKPKKSNPTNRSKSSKILPDLKDIKERFKEEARVIENCLRTNAAFRKETPIFNPSASFKDPPLFNFQNFPRRRTRHHDSPIFDPSEYLFEGYPHFRTRIYSKPDKRKNVLNNEQGRGKYDSPISEIRSDRGVLKSNSTCVYL